MDVSISTAKRAYNRFRNLGLNAVNCDLRQQPFSTAAFDLVISPSSLDHFETRQDFVVALRELTRLVKPGGILVITLDNPSNPLYHILRWASKNRLAPFPLGYTETATALEKDVRGLGFEVLGRDWLLHNPRGVSTLLFLSLRKTLGLRADRPIRGAACHV